MTTLDKLVATDLAALATHSRRQLPSVDAMLRALEVPRANERSDAAVPCELVLVRLAGVFAHRAARAAAGATAVLCVAALLVVLFDPFGRHDHVIDWRLQLWALMLERNAAAIGVSIAAVVLAVRVLAMPLARRSFERRLCRACEGEPQIATDAGLRLVRSADRWTVPLEIAGITCAVIVVGVMAVVRGWNRWYYFWDNDAEIVRLFGDRLRDLAIAVPSVVGAAVLLARACAGPAGRRWCRVFEHGGAVAAGAVVGAIAFAVGVALDVGPLSRTQDGPLPSSLLRTALTIAGAASVFLVVAWVTLRHRRREIARLGTACHPAVAVGATSELRSLAGVFVQRRARAAAGATAVACAIALLIISALGDGPGQVAGISLWGRALRWLFYEQLTIASCVAVVVLAAHVIGAGIAERALDRALQPAAEEPLALMRRLVQRIDGRSVALGVAGVSCLATLFAVIGFSLQNSFAVFLDRHGARVDSVVAHALWAMAIAMPLCVIAAAAVGRLCARELPHGPSRWLRILEHRAVVPAGVVLGLATSLLWRMLDVDVLDISGAVTDVPSAAVQAALTGLRAVSVFLIVGSFTLRRRRNHELAVAS